MMEKTSVDKMADMQPYITRKWLVERGFRFLNKTGRYVIGPMDLLSIYDRNGRFFYEGTELKYRHQVENMFKEKTGKELTIKQ